MKKLAAEFKEFAIKGNVVDLAVGIVIGAAFGKVVTSLVEDVITPPIGLMIRGVNFSDLAMELGVDPAGQPVLLRYGAFLQTISEFLLIAFALFAVIKAINRLRRSSAPAETPAPAPARTEVALLAEIRDLLAKREAH